MAFRACRSTVEPVSLRPWWVLHMGSRRGRATTGPDAGPGPQVAFDLHHQNPPCLLEPWLQGSSYCRLEGHSVGS